MGKTLPNVSKIINELASDRGVGLADKLLSIQSSHGYSPKPSSACSPLEHFWPEG